MCGRYSQSKRQRDLEFRFGTDFSRAAPEKFRYNVAPSDLMPVIVFRNGTREAEAMKWGIFRHWDKAKPPSLIVNLRAEKLLNGVFKKNLAQRRCLVPADGFYEWKTVAGKKLPVRFTMNDDSLFGLPAIYDDVHEDLGPPVRTYAIFTVEPNPLVAPVHNRMPAILSQEREQEWLDPSIKDLNKIVGMLQSYPAERMKAFNVSPALNSPRNDSPDVIKPFPE